MILQQNKNQVMDQSFNPILSNGESSHVSLGQFSTHWVFILQLKPREEQRRKINKFFYTSHGWEDNFGSSIEDYFAIMKKINRLTDETLKLKIYLVLDLPNYINNRDIFSGKEMREASFYMSIDRIYLFPFSRGEALDIKNIKCGNPLIDNGPDDFEKFIDKNEEEMAKKGVNSLLFPSFNILGDQSSKKKASSSRIKIYSCLRLQPRQYSEFMEKFKIVLSKTMDQFTITNPNDNWNEVIGDLQEAIVSLNSRQEKTFYKQMFALYKKESRFYHILNYRLKIFWQDKQWDYLALPILLMFKAIKLYFLDEQNRKKINQIFDRKGQCTLWRVAKFSGKELAEIEKTRFEDNVFYELVSFTSTSISIQAALNFLKLPNLTQYCLFQFKLTKPTFQSEIDNLNYIYLSFANLFGEEVPYENEDENEVLLNSLTVCKCTKIDKLSIDKIKKMKPAFATKFSAIYEKIDIPVIKMSVVNNLMEPYFKPSHLQSYIQGQNINDKENLSIPKSIKQYLTFFDFIRSKKIIDFGHTYQYLGYFDDASKYIKQLLEKEEQNVTAIKLNELGDEDDADLSINEQKTQMAYLKDEEISSLREIQHLQHRLSEILEKMGREELAHHYLRRAKRTCRLIKQYDKHITLMEHHLMAYKIIEKSTYSLQSNYYFHQAIRQVNAELDYLWRKSETEKFKKQVSLFNHAQYLILRGIIYFKQGDFKSAQQDIQRSREQIEKILKDLDYDNLKTQTFYIEFILHFLIEGKVEWNTKDREQFFKQRRMQNIAEATNIFGGDKQLECMRDNSKQLSEEIIHFIKLTKAKDLLDENNQLELEGPPIQKKSMVKKIEENFKNHPKTKQIEGQLENFFQYFHKIIMDNQNETKKVINKLQEQIRNLLVSDPQTVSIQAFMMEENKIQFVKNSIIHCKLTDWKSQYSLDEGPFQLERKFDELIYLKKERNKKILEENYRLVKRQDFRKYCETSCKYLKQIQEKYREGNQPLPSILESKFNYSLALNYQRLGNEEKQFEVIDQIVKCSSEKTNITVLSAIFLKVKIYYKKAEIDFEPSLLYRHQYQIQQIRAFQKDNIKQCSKCLNELKGQTDVYEQQHKNYLMKKDNHEDKIQNQIMQKQIEISLWKLKLNVFNLYLLKQTSFSTECNVQKISKSFKQILDQINAKVKCKGKHDQYLSQYYEINSFFFYIVNEQDLSFNNIKLGFSLLNQINHENQVHKVRLLTKMFFLFAESHFDSLLQYEEELINRYKRGFEHQIYWRICLAYHFNFRSKSPSPYPLIGCLKHLQTLPEEIYKKNLIIESQLKYYQSYLSDLNLPFKHQPDPQNPECSKQSKPTSDSDNVCNQNAKFYQSTLKVKFPQISKEQTNRVYKKMKTERKKHELAVMNLTKKKFSLKQQTSRSNTPNKMFKIRTKYSNVS